MNSYSDFIQLGTTARACLTSNQRGKVLASFSKAIYLLTDSGELLWITTEDSPMHRRCMQIASPLPGFLADSRFYARDQRLIIDSTCTFDLQNAAIWNAPRLSRPASFSQVQSFFLHLDLSQSKGFGCLIPNILSFAQNAFTHPSYTSIDSVSLYAQPLILDMARACLDHDPARISKNAEALIGLGTGLTPSGDDFLGGFLFAIHQTQTAYPDLELHSYAIPIEQYRSRTHLISFTLLKDLAAGHAIAPLHSIINGLLGGESFENIDPFISQLTQVGHSTGWDMLTGLLAGLLVTCRSNDFASSFQIITTMEN
jgi:hypothetical protein